MQPAATVVPLRTVASESITGRSAPETVSPRYNCRRHVADPLDGSACGASGNSDQDRPVRISRSIGALICSTTRGGQICRRQSTPVVARTNEPLHVLINALSDTLKGESTRNASAPTAGQGSFERSVLLLGSGCIAGLLEVLIRAGVTRDSAARHIATQAASLKVLDRKGQRVTAKNIVTWRARANDDLPSAGTAAFKKLASPHIADQEEAESYVRDALSALAIRGHGRDRNSE